MPGGSVYKDKVHEHPQYNTVHMSTIRVHEHYKTQETENTEKHRKYMKNTYIKTLENTKNTENTIRGTINRIQDIYEKMNGNFTVISHSSVASLSPVSPNVSVRNSLIVSCKPRTLRLY
jgi:hypothetical protein